VDYWFYYYENGKIEGSIMKTNKNVNGGFL
jgi:hypothetical protein